jgi:hypothetical protein
MQQRSLSSHSSSLKQNLEVRYRCKKILLTLDEIFIILAAIFCLFLLSLVVEELPDLGGSKNLSLDAPWLNNQEARPVDPYIYSLWLDQNFDHHLCRVHKAKLGRLFD